MTREQAIKQLEKSLDLWREFWCGTSHYISDEDIEAIELLVKRAKQNEI